MILQPDDLFQYLNVKNHEEAERVMVSVFAMLAYLKPGDEIKTSGVAVHKISRDLFQIRTRINNKEILETLESNKIVNLPM